MLLDNYPVFWRCGISSSRFRPGVNPDLSSIFMPPHCTFSECYLSREFPLINSFVEHRFA